MNNNNIGELYAKLVLILLLMAFIIFFSIKYLGAKPVSRKTVAEDTVTKYVQQ